MESTLNNNDAVTQMLTAMQGNPRVITPGERSKLLPMLKNIIDRASDERDRSMAVSKSGSIEVSVNKTCGEGLVPCDVNKGTCPSQKTLDDALLNGATWARRAVRDSDGTVRRCVPQDLLRVGVDVSTPEGRDKARGVMSDMWSSMHDLEEEWRVKNETVKGLLNAGIIDDGRMLEVGVKQSDGTVKYVSVGECEARTPDTCHIPKYEDGTPRCVSTDTFAHLPKAQDAPLNIGVNDPPKCMSREAIPFKFRNMRPEDLEAIHEGRQMKNPRIRDDGEFVSYALAKDVSLNLKNTSMTLEDPEGRRRTVPQFNRPDANVGFARRTRAPKAAVAQGPRQAWWGVVGELDAFLTERVELAMKGVIMPEHKPMADDSVVNNVERLMRDPSMMGSLIPVPHLNFANAVIMLTQYQGSFVSNSAVDAILDARKQLIVGGAHDASSMKAKLDMAAMDPVQRAMRGTDAAVRRATTMYAAWRDEERSQHWLIVAFETDGVVEEFKDRHTSLAKFLNKMPDGFPRDYVHANNVTHVFRHDETNPFNALISSHLNPQQPRIFTMAPTEGMKSWMHLGENGVKDHIFYWFDVLGYLFSSHPNMNESVHETFKSDVALVNPITYFKMNTEQRKDAKDKAMKDAKAKMDEEDARRDGEATRQRTESEEGSAGESAQLVTGSTEPWQIRLQKQMDGGAIPPEFARGDMSAASYMALIAKHKLEDLAKLEANRVTFSGSCLPYYIESNMDSMETSWMFKPFEGTGASPVDVLSDDEAKILIGDDETSFRVDEKSTPEAMCGRCKLACVYACCVMTTRHGGWGEVKNKYKAWMQTKLDDGADYEEYFKTLDSAVW